MPLVEWNESLSVGVVAFDEDHRHMIDLINQVFDALQAGRGREILAPVLEELILYTRTHTTKEEHVLRRFDYPDLEAHQREHQEMAEKVKTLYARYQAGATPALCLELLTFLKHWLTNHIMDTDKRYSAFLSARLKT